MMMSVGVADSCDGRVVLLMGSECYIGRSDGQQQYQMDSCWCLMSATGSVCWPVCSCPPVGVTVRVSVGVGCLRTVGLSGSRRAVLLREMQCCWSGTGNNCSCPSMVFVGANDGVGSNVVLFVSSCFGDSSLVGVNKVHREAFDSSIK